MKCPLCVRASFDFDIDFRLRLVRSDGDAELDGARLRLVHSFASIHSASGSDPLLGELADQRLPPRNCNPQEACRGRSHELAWCEQQQGPARSRTRLRQPVRLRGGMGTDVQGTEDAGDSCQQIGKPGHDDGAVQVHVSILSLINTSDIPGPRAA